jgi:hypothetical protein
LAALLPYIRSASHHQSHRSIFRAMAAAPCVHLLAALVFYGFVSQVKTLSE